MNIAKHVLYFACFVFTTGMFIFLVRRAKTLWHRAFWILLCTVFSVLLLGLRDGAIAFGIAYFFTSGLVRNTVFEYFKLRTFQARVQAELMAQHKDQSFTNALCHKPDNMEYISSLQESAYFKQDKVAPFIVVCGLLGRGLEDTSLNDDQRVLCARLLADRLQRASTNQQFRLQHLLVFGELEDKLESWITHHETLNQAS